jgi:hypothetical protein
MDDSKNPYDSTDRQTETSPIERQPRTVLNLVIAAAIIVVVTMLILPMRRTASEAARRMSCSSNLRCLGLAILAYEKDYQCLPPAYTVDANGRRLHSWRTLILPYVAEESIYQLIDLTKPWNDPVHDKVRQKFPDVFRCPSTKASPGFTTFQTVIAERSCLQPASGRKLSEIVDGSSTTVVLVETPQSQAVHWMQPQDIDLSNLFREESRTSTENRQKYAHSGGFHVVLLDGSTRLFSVPIDRDDLTAMITIDGGEQGVEIKD